MAATLGGLLLSVCGLGGATILTAAGALWFGLFLLSRPLQKRDARSLDSRRPGVTLSEATLSVPTLNDSTHLVRLGEPFELTYGWREYVSKGTGGPTSNTRTVLTHATLKQGGVGLFLMAEDSAREATAAGWPEATYREADGLTHVRLWACDLVTLVESIRNSRAGSYSCLQLNTNEKIKHRDTEAQLSRP